MKHSSGSWLGSGHQADSTQHTVHRVLLLALCCLLSAGVGCEALQRKFTRTPKRQAAAPTPIVQFQDYTKAMTPLDRYRKHFLIFEYWNAELIDVFTQPSISAKRVQQTSAEALAELKRLQRLLNDEAAARLEPMITDRGLLDERLQAGRYWPGEHAVIQRTLERQAREITRKFAWREVEDQLQADAPGD